jgi:N-acyl-D-amino-acid deacylase
MIHVFPAVGALMSNGGMGGPRPKGTPRSGNVAQGDRTMWKKKLSSRSGLLSACLAVAATVTGCATQPAEPVISVVLAGGTVFAGEDREGFVADVWIRGDRIAGIGDASSVRAEVRLDVSGLAVAPGFIDLHSHAIRDNPERSGIFRWPDAENEVRQGVTTVVGGPDGWSPLPLEETFVELEAHPAAVNFGAFVGHGAVREKVVGLADRPPTADELERMRALVDQAMRQGAFGLSSGLVYTPGSFGDTEEVIELAKVAGRHGGIYISHMRNEALEVLDSVTELIRIAEQGGLPGQITHAKAMGTAMQGKSADMLALVDEANARGLDISLDQYPYTAGSTGLTVQFPLWSRDGGDDRLAERLADPELRARIKEHLVYELTHVRGRNDPANVQLAYCGWDHSLDGLNLSQILERQSREVTIGNAAELIMELQAAGGCQAIYHAMHADDVVNIMRHPRTMIAADGGIEVPGNGHPHPRNYGTFARVLGRYVREQGVMPLHTAIHKMTRMPADRIGLRDRGRIEPGAIADIVVFDPDAVIDRATFEDPHQYAEGMVHVFVAGEAVLLNGKMTGARPGRVLRSASYEKGN